jgi:mRNA-degrading endonuclease RelE of RelBE toxin-antitoxin system
MPVRITPEAFQQIEALPVSIHRRVLSVLERMGRWPEVSGAKPLRYELKGCFRVRTGDWRVVVRSEGEIVWVIAVDNRKNVYK